MRLSLLRKSTPIAVSLKTTDQSFSGTQRHRVKIFNINNGQSVSQFEPYSGFLRDRSAPISAAAFHPHRLMIAAAALHDNHVNIFGCRDSERHSVKTVRLRDAQTSMNRVSTFM
jgi:regulator-associated protein of mTOR